LIIEKVLKELVNTKEDDWGLYQLFDIAVLIYKDENDVLSDTIWKEMKFDSNDDMRKLYKEIKKKVIVKYAKYNN
jgi:hypothetical protein